MSFISIVQACYFCRMMMTFGRFFICLVVGIGLGGCKSQPAAPMDRAEEGVFEIPTSVSKDSIDPTPSSPHPVKGMIYVPGGRIDLMDPRSQQSASVFVTGFLLDSTEVPVSDFKEFVESTGYKTDAEKFGNAAVFDMQSRTWGLVDGAQWKFPQGPLFPESKNNDPVTQISWFDAHSFCAWKGKRLPNEIEWEHAARNGNNDQYSYSWGDDWETGGLINGNVWQGEFPVSFKNLDGFETVAPVGSFRSSPLGFKDLSGNVWEWCDNWRFEYNELESGKFFPVIEKAMRGGSFLCAPNYCHGYRISSRSFTTPETSLFHLGCRCAMDVK